jgi:transcriptional regulator with XRE-family HTH domain
MRIGQNIKTTRLLRNLTQEAVAKKLGLSLTAYGDIERGCTDNITIKRLDQIAKVLDVTVEELINEGKESSSNNYQYFAKLNADAIEGYKLALLQKDNEIAYVKQQLQKAERELKKLRK